MEDKYLDLLQTVMLDEYLGGEDRDPGISGVGISACPSDTVSGVECLMVAECGGG
jgi:hypothetical protein